MIIVAKTYYFIYSGGEDVACHVENLRNLLHGSFYVSTLGANFIANHCAFLSFFLLPFYAVYPDPLLLQYFKIVAFFIGAFIFFLLLRKRLNPFIALGAMIVFTLAPANIGMLDYHFDYEPFSIPLIFLIFKALDDKKYILYMTCCFLLAMVKEQMPLVVMMFGIFAYFYTKENKIKWALVPLMLGLTVFIVEVFVLTPYVRNGLPSVHWDRYAQFGHNPQEIIFFLFSHPGQALSQCISPKNIKWYNELFGVWGSLSFFSPQILLIAFPLFLKTLLSNNGKEHAVLTFYYASTFTPFIYLAAWNTLNYIQNKWRIYVHALAIIMMFLHFLNHSPNWLALFNTPITEGAAINQRFIDQIPQQASVLATQATLAPLSNRKELYYESRYLNGYYVVGRKFKMPSNLDYILLDLTQTQSKNGISRISSVNFDSLWQLQESIEDMALYVRNPSRQKANRLIERSFRPFPIKNLNLHSLDGTIRLEAIDFPKIFPQKYRIFPVTMYWKCLKKTNTPYEIFINITSADKNSYYTKQRPIGSAIYPTYFWRKGEHIKESYFYLLPHIPRGNFDIGMSIYNPISKNWVDINKETFSVN